MDRMEKNLAISFRANRAPDDDGLVRLEIEARSESFSAVAQEYVGSNHLAKFAQSLKGFPAGVPDGVQFNTGAGRHFIAVELKTINALGHIAIRATFATEPRFYGIHLDVEKAEFWLMAEPSAIDRFARELVCLLRQGGEAILMCVAPSQRFV